MNKEEWIEMIKAVKTVEANQEKFKNWFIEQEEERMQFFDNYESVLHIEEAREHFAHVQGVYKYEYSTHFTAMDLS